MGIWVSNLIQFVRQFVAARMCRLQDSIKRYGGPTAPSAPWPQDLILPDGGGGDVGG